MRRLTVGVIGHVDHGKTTLVRQLTGIETDRLAAEKARGISIVLGFAPLPFENGVVDLVDMPGHEKFVRTMIAGATGTAAVLLVVAADEGIKPQTMEHLQIAALLGVRRGVIAVSKSDLADSERAAEVGEAAADLAHRLGIGRLPWISTSERTGEGVADLRTALGRLLTAAEAPPEQGFFWLPIDRAFAIPGFGTVVTGTLRRGSLAVGDAVDVLPSGLSATVRGLQAHGRKLERAPAGSRVAVNLRGLDAKAVKPGDALATPGYLAASDWIDMRLELLDTSQPLPNGSRLELLVGTMEAAARLRLLDRDILDPGAQALCQLRLDQPMFVPARERFIVRRASPPATLGGGIILDPTAHRRRRNDGAGLALLAALADGDPQARGRAFLSHAGQQGIALVELARRVGLGKTETERIAGEQGVLLGRGLAMDTNAFATLSERIVAALRSYQTAQPLLPGLTASELSARIGGNLQGMEPVLARLTADRKLRHERGVYAPKDMPSGPVSGSREQALAARLAARFRDAGLSPPDLSAAAPDEEHRQAVFYLIRKGALISTTDRVQKRTIVFHREAVEAARRLLAERLSGPEGFLAGQAGAVLGTTRKFSIPLLEHLDATGVTRRDGDRRWVEQHQAEAASRRAEAR